jgi:hypothetical protein
MGEMEGINRCGNDYRGIDGRELKGYKAVIKK